METSLNEFTSHLGRLDEGSILILAAREGRGPIRVSVRTGQHYYVHCTALGKVLLSALPVNQVAKIIERQGLAPRTPYTITTLARLRRELALVRRRGFAVVMEENTLGVASIGAPILGADGRPLAAISVSVAAQEVRTRHGLNQLAERVLAVAGRIADTVRDVPMAPLQIPQRTG
jgi:DNA-binding IclR family transcriptional regulator